MKNFKVLLSALIISGAMFSCSDDDNGGSNLGGDLTARWNPQKTVLKAGNDEIVDEYDQNDPDCDPNYVEFTEDNQVRIVGYANPVGDCQEIVDPEVTTYTRSENNIVISGSDATQDVYEGAWEIVRLTGSELRLRNTTTLGGIQTITTIYFEKAASQQ